MYVFIVHGRTAATSPRLPSEAKTAHITCQCLPLFVGVLALWLVPIAVWCDV